MQTTLTDSPRQISKIKERVEEKEGIPPVQQRLIYGGKQMCVYVSFQAAPRLASHVLGAAGCGAGMQHGVRLTDDDNRSDDKTASEYSLEGGATLHLVLALRGGSQ